MLTFCPRHQALTRCEVHARGALAARKSGTRSRFPAVRKSRIEIDLQAPPGPIPRPSARATEAFRSVSLVPARIGWYLYLAETVLNRPLSYEPIQGPRVLPIFEQLGSRVALLDRIGDLREQCLGIINPERRNPDPGPFEILTALL